MRYSVCIIDDKIPTAGVDTIRDSELLNASNLQLLLQEIVWTDSVVKNLIQTLLDQTETNGTRKWDVYGFTNPAFYVNALNDALFRSDLIVFDWEYPGIGSGADTDSEDILKEILEKSFCIIFIFSGVDRKPEVDAILAKPEFQEYKERLHYLDKTLNGVEQTDLLLQKAEEMYTSNFSFRFASDLRRKAVQVMDKILSELGRATLNHMKNYLKLEEGCAKRDLLDFIAERFRSCLIVSEISDIGSGEQQGTSFSVPDSDLIQKIWSYRLYLPLDTTDELVRRGDIVKYSDKYFLVVSADCDLKRFWHKNFGSINLLPLHRLNNSNSELKDMLTFCLSPNDLKQGDFKHLIDKIGKLTEGPFILPFLKINGSYENFVVMPKEFTTQKINIPVDIKDLSKEKRKEKHLKYVWWEGTEKVCSIAEPFLTAIIQHVFTVMGGYGVPDYPSSMKTVFQGILNDFISTPTQ